MAQRWNSKGGEKPGNRRENPPTSGNDQHDSHVREPGIERPNRFAITVPSPVRESGERGGGRVSMIVGVIEFVEQLLIAVSGAKEHDEEAEDMARGCVMISELGRRDRVKKRRHLICNPKHDLVMRLARSEAVVWDSVSVGIGYSQVEELMSVLNIAMIARETFHRRETSMRQRMIENGKKEKDSAIAKGNVENGIPYISVIGDGGWDKRTYGHSYKSTSGEAVYFLPKACIIGAETNQLLYLGVKVKNFVPCVNLQKNNVTKVKEHVCFKKYSGPSTGMEQLIIEEKYKLYIDDGDSSVYLRIQQRVPYGREIVEVECANHTISKNVSFPLPARRLLESRIVRLKSGARKATERAEKSTECRAVVQLKHDIRNGPYHVFHCHENCR
ncbi:hypothetical protein PR048_018863 [Dryococelus australis]|uniref:Mutator-like transposase domain-containing protein n=1 Tax=Dryococelus australis TaxID=614101 RepID=A0ABQ9H272_9NEOP|nr:hypothetical protein PR048_018863 [Dryococelus australis]